MSKHTTLRCDVCGRDMTHGMNRVELRRAESIGGGTVRFDVQLKPVPGMYHALEDVCDTCQDDAVKQAARNIDEARARRATRLSA